MKSKNILKLSVLAGAIALLSACKTDITTEIPFSGMLSDGIKETTAELKVEVISCEDFEDSRKESDSLIKSREEIIKLIPTAQFKECYKEKFDSFATFSLPINYGQGDFTDVGNISIATEKNDDNSFSTSVIVPKQLKQAINEKKNERYSLEKIDLEKLKININIKNDTDTIYTGNAISVYVNGTPSQAYEIVFDPNSSTQITLSNVSTQLGFSLDSFAHNPLILSSIKAK